MSDVLKGKTLLIVEDEVDLREPLALEFESLGCRVFQAENGTKALAIIEAENIDAVISDIRMPGGDGVSLLKAIKRRNHAFPVVMLITGFSDLSREDAYDLGAEAILSKPFDLDEMDATVIRILTPREARWESDVPALKIKKVLDKSFSELEAAHAEGDLKLGRGGFFIKGPGHRLALGDFVSINIHFSGGNLLRLEGSGVVRWVRADGSNEMPGGCGIEFASLGHETRAKILHVTDALKITPFIPKG